MKFLITHTTKYQYPDPVSACKNKAHLRPRSTAWQRCTDYRLLVVPEPVELNIRTDYFGNEVDYFSLHMPHRSLSVTATSSIDLDPAAPPPKSSPPWETIQQQLVAPASDAILDACLFRFDSAFAYADTKFADYARISFTPGRPVFEAASDLMHRVHAEFKYDPRATTISTPLAQVFAERAGVCQDFAHLQIACLRSLGLAARYVSGYLRTLPPPGKPRLVGADASHAWISLYCGEAGWIDFDPTNDVIPGTDHLTLAYGRDYGDVCPLQGIFVGGGDHTMSVSVDVNPVET